LTGAYFYFHENKTRGRAGVWENERRYTMHF
jgi:hypothetical protein